MEVKRVTVFPREGKGGNKAAVVLKYEGLGDHHMQEIAGEIGYSETVFLTKKDKNNFFARYFTPNQEVDMCGHASIAAYAVLKREGYVEQGKDFSLETKAGVIELREENCRVFLKMPVPQLIRKLDVQASRQLNQIMCPEGWEGLIESYPIVQCGLSDIMFSVDCKEKLDQLSPDFEKMSKFSHEQSVVGVHAYYFEKDQMKIYARNFAPLYGITEESATGTSNGGLAFFLWQECELKDNVRFQITQGETMGESSSIEARIGMTDNKLECYVGGLVQYIVEE